MANKKVKSVNLLPEFLRTKKNSKFLSSTIDQLVQPADLERIDGYIGSKLSPTYNSKVDSYISENFPLRQNYQLEPALVVKDADRKITDVIGIDDLINQLHINGSVTDNLDRLFRSEYYSFDPNIDWDKFVNFQEYYWLETGPDVVEILGSPKNTTSTYSVIDNTLTTSFIFSPDGLTEDPIITLYRGNTYNFNIDSKYKFYIKTQQSLGTADLYNVGVTNNGISNGVLSITVNELTPDTLFYISDIQEFAQGRIVVKSIAQDSFLDVEAEIIGKKYYTSYAGISFTNGMKIKFSGNIYPESYQNKEFFVEGVGSSIKLINYQDLYSSEGIANIFNENFDASAFDSFPFDKFKSLPINPEYFTINRASNDSNPWSRYNRWFHSDIIRLSATLNGKQPVFPLDKRAKRPIIEFKPNIQLFNFGSSAIKNVDILDTYTTDAFSVVEGSAGYYADEILLEQGHRIIFNADNDPSVRGNIYVVNFVKINNQRKIRLSKAEDHKPFYKASVSIKDGKSNKGTSWWFNGTDWVFAQQHTTLNQPPLFDVFDKTGNSYSEYYESSFKGTKIFSYEIGTGANDPVLGIPLKYENSVGAGSYLFRNDFLLDSLTISVNEQTNETIPLLKTFLKLNDPKKLKYLNVWKNTYSTRIPIIQFQTIIEPTNKIQITVLDTINISDVTVDVSINTQLYRKKVNSDEYHLDIENNKIYVVFNNSIESNANVIFKIFTSKSPNKTGYYSTPTGLTNNPKNKPISYLTLSEMSDHLQSMVNNSPDFQGNFPGVSNIRDLDNITQYGNVLITNINPIAFANFFIGKKEHNLLDAITKVSDQYNSFKLNFINKISEFSDQTDILGILESALIEINKNKTEKSAYFYSDMVPYGTDKTIRTWKVTDPSDKLYPLGQDYNPFSLTNTACLVYINNVQLILDKDYKFNVGDSLVEIKINLNVGDTIQIVEYQDTTGSFVPMTPTKLGLFPAFEPSIFLDETYAADPVLVIQGHDGSTTKAYGDYRDDVILELEKRIFNNIKTRYNSKLFDINKIIPGAFRNTEYSVDEINSILQRDFVRWAGIHGIDYITNNTFDDQNQYTWNFKDGYLYNLNLVVSGSWKNIYNYLYGTIRPDTHPWEMLGFNIKPDWWDSEYGPSPYSAGNDILWEDIETGTIKHGDRQGVDLIYARPGLIRPVDSNGKLVEPSVLITDLKEYNKRLSWKFGDLGPAEAYWRRSSYYPFAIQKLLALTYPATYASLMYDTSRLEKNIANQWVYDDLYLNFDNLNIYGDNGNLTSGYSAFITEVGLQRNSGYLSELATHLSNNDFNLFYKAGGFVSKNKLQIIIDSFDPLSTSPGALLPQENYDLILNVSNPIKSSRISGIILQKLNGKFVVKGYDQIVPYFTTFSPIRNNATQTITVGGISESYVVWASSSSSGASGLSAADTTSASSAISGKFYQVGQVVSYNSKFYRVKTAHISESIFNEVYFQELSSLPIKGGATVQVATKFNSIEKKIPYGTEFEKIQDVYDFIVGYGKWLETNGFIFDEFNSDLNSVIDWDFSAKEFLYWTTQNWANNSIITLSPFAEKLKFQYSESTVDDIFENYYEYSLLQSNGTQVPPNVVSVNREDGLFTLETLNFNDGIYFAVLNSVQKEHAIVFNNKTIFNDTIYDSETGYRQLRMKLYGFRTKNWDGDYFSPGFVYDFANILSWKEYTDYQFGSIVKFNGKYYSAKTNLSGTTNFDFNDWSLLNDKPVADLIPNFDYKINQFEDFYSLDIDNFDSSQQKMAQHLIGYTPRVYLNNIFTNPISQYKFYQGFIKEKGTKNALDKLSKASIHNLQGKIEFSEEWAFRIGHYGSYDTFKEIEIPLSEQRFIENPQIVNVVTGTNTSTSGIIYNVGSEELIIKPDNFNVNNVFVTKSIGSDNFELNVAGYARLDDINYTAFDEAELLSILNNNLINQNDIVWVGFKNNNDWDVFRYTLAVSNIVNARIKISGSELIFTTENFHSLKVGDLISITQVDSQVNGVYKVKSIPSLVDFIVPTDLEEIADIEFILPGLVFKFESQRFANFLELPSSNKLLKLPYKTKFWIDNDATDNWVVFEKIRNFKNKLILPEGSANQRLGWRVLTRDNLKLISAIDRHDGVNIGRVTVNLNEQYFVYFYLNDTQMYCPANNKTDFGYALEYDTIEFNNTGFGLIFAGAPATSYLKAADVIGDIRYASGTGEQSIRVQEGAVKIISIDPVLIEENPEIVLLSPNPSNYERFGSSIYVQKDSNNSRLLLVGACGTSNTGTGHVYSFSLISTATVHIDRYDDILEILPGNSISLDIGSQWGYSISGSNNGEVIAISAPGWNNDTGFVQIFNKSVYQFTIKSNTEKVGERFGEKVTVDPTGKYLFVTTPNYKNNDLSFGRVSVYQITITNSSTTYLEVTNLYNPRSSEVLNFGADLDVDSDANTLIVSSLGTDNFNQLTFDKFLVPYDSEELSILIDYLDINSQTASYVNDSWQQERKETTFDKGSTTFFDSIRKTGLVYVYDKKQIDNSITFILTQEIRSTYALNDNNFGHSISLNNDEIYVGAPAYSADTVKSAYYVVNKVDPSFNGWKTLRRQENVIDPLTIRKVTLVDSFNEEVVDYLELIDPIKGKISGLADQEIRYKSFYDPAVYSSGSATNIIDENSNWTSNHVGELWWDLTKVKYIWYEQGELLYRKNNWGKLFPGSTIDIYEWIESDYLPSEYSAIADSSAGLTEGISGQPRYDDSVVSIKQVYDSVSSSFRTKYYYWVRNKVTVPNVQNRRISAFQVSKIIADPAAYGASFISIISPNAISLSNVGNMLIGDRISVNLSFDIINNDIPKHTEWLLLQENSSSAFPNILLEKKLMDSLLGHDSLGNHVPDLSLPNRLKYGISIRPRQSLFKNRLEALRNLFEFVNDILKKTQITGNYSFVNLEKQEEIPVFESNEYDQIVDNNESLQLIDTRKFIPANKSSLTCFVENGKIKNVVIDNPGIGYKAPPTIEIVGQGQDAEIVTEIDSLGRIINVTIVNPGSGYSSAPVLNVRGYSVIVLADSLYNNKWTKFVFDIDSQKWFRFKTQKFNTSLYWEYIDWSHDVYNPYKDYKYTFNDVYELEKVIDIEPGDYVKVKNSGNGTYIILEKTEYNVQGTFNDSFNLIYSEKGTIQILDSIWNLTDNSYNFDQNKTFDQTLFDQTPDLELEYILKAIKFDIFVGELKINWNLFFFKAVKYALTEQKLLDWAFKTSFINVINKAGLLDTRPVYKLQNSSYFEEYISEVKPYHTKIRNFITQYDAVDNSNSYITDFDLPAKYNRETDTYESISLGNSNLTQLPWKSWADNYTYKISNISVGNPGSGYLVEPLVEIVSAPGDTGSGATARAYVRSGSVYSIEVTNPGSGYVKPPMVIIKDNGYSELIPATAYAQLTNEKIRSNKIGIKFDRISNAPAIGDKITTDRFICNGVKSEFVLNWLAEKNKSSISITLDGTIVLGSDYTIVYYVEEFNGYSKKYSKVVFLNYVPGINQVLEITYPKSVELFNATERILTDYKPTQEMPGIDLPQLMYGVEYPQNIIEGLSFSLTSKWDNNYSSFGNFTWASDVSNYNLTTVVTSATVGTNLLRLQSVDNLSEGNYVNIIGSTTSAFNTSTTKIVSINNILNEVTLSDSIVRNINSGEQIEFWSTDNNENELDTNIEGGSWDGSLGVFTGALGINPDDVIIDGEQFLNPNSSYGPEEFVPGHVVESIAINVFTKNSFGAPNVFSGFFNVNALEGARHQLPFAPPSIQSISVILHDKLLNYVAENNFSSREQFSIDWETNELIIPQQIVGGMVGYNLISIGGGLVNAGAGVIDSNSTTIYDYVNSSTAIQVTSLASYQSVKSAYVTLDGFKVNPLTTGTTVGYVLTFANNDNNRAAVNVYGVPAGKHTVQAWFFSNVNKYFNEITEQTFVTTSTEQSIFGLISPPGNIKPEVAHILVEKIEDNTRRRLIPPLITYYDVTNSINLTYLIDNKISRPSGTFNLTNVNVYLNGVMIRPGFDYTVSSINNTITFSANLLKVKDVIVIVGLVSGDYDYNVVNGSLILANPVTFTTLKVTTYTDHDGMLMRTEKFQGNSARRYKVSRSIFNDNYVWVTVNGRPLTAKLDFEVLDDTVTIQVSDAYEHTSSDIVIIVTVSNDSLSSTVLGYKIFNDIFNRTHFKRIAKANTTYLIQSLMFTDTSIYVDDPDKLTPPSKARRRPGVVWIDGERIEFWKIEDNALTELRRATLGTSPSFYSEINTKVVDQSHEQDIPFKEKIYKQTLYTTSNTNTYFISTVTTTATGDGIVLSLPSSLVFTTNKIDTALASNYADRALRMIVGLEPVNLAFDLNGDGSVTMLDANGYLRLSNKLTVGFVPSPLSNFTDLLIKESIATNTINAVDQVAIFYGGRLLKKSGSFYQDTTVSYDSSPFILKGTIDSELNLPYTSVIGNAYIVTATNQVWIYSESNNANSINGYVYNGINYLEPEFTINTSTQALILNIKDGIQDNIKLTIMKKEFARNTVWNNEIDSNSTISLIDSTTEQAKFLKLKPAELPDNYYYGGDPTLVNDNGFALTDNSDEPLEGF